MQRTTIRLDDHLLAEAKEYAARYRLTLTSLIEDALRARLARSRNGGRPTAGKELRRLPVSKHKGGFLPGVNVDSNSDLLDLMERGLPLEKRR